MNFQEYNEQKSKILKDKLLSDEGKREKIKELFNTLQQRHKANISVNKLHQESIQAKIGDLMKERPTRKLPTVNFPKDYLTKGDIQMAGITAQIVAMMAEQRAADMLNSRVAMAENVDEIVKAAQMVLAEPFGPQAILRSMDTLVNKAASFNGIGNNAKSFNAKALYAMAEEASLTESEFKEREAWMLKLAAFNDRANDLMRESILIEAVENKIQEEGITLQGDEYFSGRQFKDNTGADHYFGKSV